MIESDLQLMQIQAETLYCYDADGRLRCINEPGDPPAPRFFMGRTPQGNLWRFRYDLPTEIAQQLEALCRSEPVGANLTHAPLRYDAIRAVLQAQTPIEEEFRGPAYRVPDNIQPPPGVVLVSEANEQLFQRPSADAATRRRPWLAGRPRFAAAGASRSTARRGTIWPRRAWRASWGCGCMARIGRSYNCRLQIT